MAGKKGHTQSKSGRKGGSQGYVQTQRQEANINPMAAATAGAIVGAAAGAVAGAVLSNDKTRKQIGEALQTVRDRTMDTVKNVSQSAPKSVQEVKHVGKKKMEEMKEK